MSQRESRPAEPVLSQQQIRETIASIAGMQQASGSIPWPDGHTDVWDHVECAMALVVGGQQEQARAAYDWVVATQNADGSWATSYDQRDVLDATIDTNQCAYIAVGMWQWWLHTRDSQLPRQLWPCVKAALDFVVSMQRDCGASAWSKDPDGTIRDESLLTGSSSTYQALRCGVALAELLGQSSAGLEWELAAEELRTAVVHRPHEFLDKSRFSMDWYYPVLGGAHRGQSATAMLASKWDEFVVPGYGARCVSDRPWVTGAETAELAIALLLTGQHNASIELLRDVQCLRREDGSYWTGIVFDEGKFWPGEASSWTAAAMVLACDALAGGSSLDVFSGKGLPTSLSEPAAVRLPSSPARSGNV